ncbi:hypothetical protein F4805DRAFT_434823 [Annulohypoxylon moriforme]|nr:hypothetical protein F4805DRAFT_434823 [Annulohypoxylon moriforme]
MADPLTILGAAGVSFQFAGYAIKGLLRATELAHDIHDAPERITQCLSHIDHEVALVNFLLRPDSPIFDQLSNTQYARISKPAIEARKLMEEIQQDLSPLSDNNQDPRKRYKKWNAVVRAWNSLRYRKDLEDKMKSLDRLHARLSRELEISGFETQSLLRDQSSQLLSDVAAILANIPTSPTNPPEAQQLMHQICAIQSEILDTIQSRKQLYENINTLEQHIRDSVDTLLQEVRNDVVSPTSQFHAQMSIQHVELFSLLRDVSNQTTHISAILSQLQMFTDLIKQQPHADNTPPIDVDSTIDIDFRRGTTRLETSSSAVQFTSKPVGLQDRQNTRRCRCGAGIRTSLWTYGKFGFRSKTQSMNKCPTHGKKHTRSYIIEARLSPFLQGTLELTLDLLCGRKGWEIAPFLKFKNTVKRSNNRIFQLFDQYTKIQTAREIAYWDSLRYSKPSAEEMSLLTLEKHFMKGTLTTVVRAIEESIELGQSSGNDIDEDGSTLLLEIFTFVSRFLEFTEYAGDEISRLLYIAKVSEVDPTATSTNTRPSPGPYTAIEFLVRTCIDGSGCQSISFYSSLLEYDGLMQPLEEVMCSCRFREQGLVIAYPEIAEGLGYSDLQLAVIRRSLFDLERLYVDNQFTPKRLSLTELAVGWPNGLRFLVDRRGEIEDALEIACMTKDQESASILISTNLPIFKRNLLSSTSFYKPIFLMFTEELWRRREDLRMLALHHLDQKEQDKVGLSEPSTFRENTRELYRLLRRKIEIPERLVDAMEVLVHCSTSFHYELDHHMIAYDVGFVNVDIPCEHNITPLAETSEALYISRCFIEPCDSIAWLLKKGACPMFHLGDCSITRWPHLLFYIARMEPETIWGFIREIKNELKYEYITDQCKCFCSRGGCVPPAMLWHCTPSDLCGTLYDCSNQFNHRFMNLQYWSEAWKLPKKEKEDCYRAMCQLELFERLGMVHTCCFGSQIIACDAKAIQLEDKISALQLKKLLRMYKTIRKLLFNVPIVRFWTIWWTILDQILPPLSTEEACCGKRYPSQAFEKRVVAVVKLREDKWADMLKTAGYGGLDFGEVIKRHFAKYLLLCSMAIQRRDRWKSHRLVGRLRPLGSRRRR